MENLDLETIERSARQPQSPRNSREKRRPSLSTSPSSPIANTTGNSGNSGNPRSPSYGMDEDLERIMASIVETPLRNSGNRNLRNSGGDGRRYSVSGSLTGRWASSASRSPSGIPEFPSRSPSGIPEFRSMGPVTRSMSRRFSGAGSVGDSRSHSRVGVGDSRSHSRAGVGDSRSLSRDSRLRSGSRRRKSSGIPESVDVGVIYSGNKRIGLRSRRNSSGFPEEEAGGGGSGSGSGSGGVRSPSYGMDDELSCIMASLVV